MFSRTLRTFAAAVILGLVAQASVSSAAPDLLVEKLLLSPDSGPNATAVDITATIRNQGDATAAESTTRIRINQDPGSVGSSDIILCGSLATASLTPGSSVDVGCKATLSQRPDGANYIWAIADVNKTAGQLVVDNDRKSALFTVVSTPAPDLIVQSIVVAPTSVTNGQAVTITVTIKNQGNAAAQTSTTRIRINQDAGAVTPADTELCNIATPTVAVDASVQIQCVQTIDGRPAGTNYVWAIADVNKSAGQTDTTNDRGAAALEVAASPAADLVIDSVVVNPTSGPNGKSVSITATIRNQGNAAALASAARIRINQDPDKVGSNDTQLCGPINTPSIAVGSTAQVKCTPTVTDRPTGTNYIWAIADSGDTAGQSDRTNDDGSTLFTVDPAPTPDLVVRTVSLSPASGPNGTSVTVTARIANDGAGNAPASKTRIVINQSADAVADTDAVLCDQVDTAALTPGASVQVKCKATLAERPAGNNFVWAVADITDLAGQDNRDNDKLAAAFNVVPAPAPDLVVESLRATSTSAPRGASVAITARIQNQGNATAAPSTTRFRINTNSATLLDTDPILCGAVPTGSLSAGSAVDINCNWTIGDEASGPAYLWATADIGASAGQTDLSNDSRNIAFTVTPPDGPDLTVTRLTVRPARARNGESLVIKVRIANVGNRDARASVTTLLINQNTGGVADGDDVLCPEVATPALAPQASVAVRCAATINARPIGANLVWAVLDTTATSGQIDANNDRASTPLTVAPAECADPSSTPTLAWPLEQPRVVQDYASFGSVPLSAGALGYHSGIDLLSQMQEPPDRTPVYAAADGEVVALRRGCPSPADAAVNPPDGRCTGGWGNYVVVRHGAGVYSVYAHLGKVFARRGCVEQGERIAIVGSSGSTTIPVQLHFGVLANLIEPLSRKALGAEYYKNFHPFAARLPESPDGALQTHLDPRDFMMRSRIRITQATAASRAGVSGGAPAYLAKDQQYVSYGELVPGFFCIDMPSATLAQDGPPYADDVRYGWVAAADVEVLESGLAPGSLRIDGYAVFTSEGVGAGAVAMREQATETSSEVSKAWGGQQFVASGVVVTEPGNGRQWQPVDVPGSAATGAGKPRKAWLPLDLLGPPPQY